MKVHKMVSLNPETAQIAEGMNNFSAFVRQSLRAYAVDSDVASEMARRARWARAANMLAEMCVGYAKALDDEYDEDPAQLAARVFAQTVLEDFE